MKIQVHEIGGNQYYAVDDIAEALMAVFVGFNLLGEFTLGGQLSLHTGLFLLLTTPLCFAELNKTAWAVVPLACRSHRSRRYADADFGR